jgi:type III restriction enzyme
VRARDVKVLSLFFIDRVANYWDYNAAGQPVQGKFAVAYQIERHIRRDKDEGPNRLRKEVQISPEFQAL